MGGFFVGWPVKPSPQRHLELLRGSYAVELALDAGRLIGFATAISDGVLSAYIPLLEVLPGYQAQGIGSALIRRLVERLDGLYMIDLNVMQASSPSMSSSASRFWIARWATAGTTCSDDPYQHSPRREVRAVTQRTGGSDAPLELSAGRALG